MGSIPAQLIIASDHTVVVNGDRTLWAWGSNRYGQIGNGIRTPAPCPTPTQVLWSSGTSTRFSDVIATAAGAHHTLAVRADGSVWAWGRNDSGQVGDRTRVHRSLPVQVGRLTDIVSVAAGRSHSVALREDGTVWAWGANDSGQLGNGVVGSRSRGRPVQVHGSGNVGFLSDIVAIAAGGSHTLALSKDGTVWSWGYDSRGELGHGGTVIDDVTGMRLLATGVPGLVAGLEGIAAIAAGIAYSIALKTDGTIWAWGRNDSGQLGDGTTTDRNTPAQARGVGEVVSVSAGHRHAVVALADGTVWAWGSNQYGQLGVGGAHSCSPRTVSVVDEAAAVAAGAGHTVALKRDGTVWAWGRNDSGQRGDGTSNRSGTPHQCLFVTTPRPVRDFAAIGGDTMVWLTWKNPVANDFEAVRILRSTTRHAIGPDDREGQTPIYEGAQMSCSNAGLSNGSTYYWTAFARDTAGNWSIRAVAVATPVHDRTAPKGTVAINGGTPTTRSAVVTLEAPAIDSDTGVMLMRISNSSALSSGLLTPARVHPYEHSIKWDLADHETGGSEAVGEHTVHVQWRDAAGNWSTVESATIRLESTQPGPDSKDSANLPMLVRDIGRAS